MVMLTPDKIDVSTSLAVAGLTIFDNIGNSTLPGDVVISGDLTVNGTTTTVNTELQTADRYILLNSEYTGGAPLTAGLVFNIDPDPLSYAITDITSNVITLGGTDDATTNLATADFVLIQGPGTAANAGVYEVLSVTASSVTINSTPTESFAGTSLVDDATVQGVVIGIRVSVLRSTTAGAIEVGTDTAAPISYSALTTSNPPLSTVLTQGNVTAGSNLLVTSGDIIDAATAVPLVLGGTTATQVTLGSATIPTSAAGWLNVGSATSAVALGDFAAGDGTNSFKYTSATPVASVSDGTSDSRLAAGSISAVRNHAATNTLYDAITLAATNSTGVGAAGLGSTILWTAESTSGAQTEQGRTNMFWEQATQGATYTGYEVILRRNNVFQTLLTIGNSITANGAGRVEVPTGLMVGTASSAVIATGDIIARDGTRELNWDAGTAVLALNGAAATINSNNTLTMSATGVLSLDSTTNVIQTNATSITADAALSLLTTGANALTLDAGGAAAVNVGTTNANAVNVAAPGVTTTIGETLAGVGANAAGWDIQTTATELTGLSGAIATASSLIPAGSMVIGVSTHVTTLITGATTFDIGDGTDPDRWGATIAVAATTTTDGSDFTDNTVSWQTATAGDVVLTANGSSFTAGAVRIVVTYMSLNAPTS